MESRALTTSCELPRDKTIFNALMAIINTAIAAKIPNRIPSKSVIWVPPSRFVVGIEISSLSMKAATIEGIGM